MCLKIGEIKRVRVKKIIDIGAIVELESHRTGFIHISELSDSYVKDPKEILDIGAIVEAQIISIKNNRIGLSIRSLKKRLKDQKTKEMQFEDMMKQFKVTSEEKLSDLKKKSTKRRNKIGRHIN